MIISPCRNCSKKNLPKDLCSEKCEMLHTIQEFDISIKEDVVAYSLDYADENSISIDAVMVV